MKKYILSLVAVASSLSLAAAPIKTLTDITPVSKSLTTVAESNHSTLITRNVVIENDLAVDEPVNTTGPRKAPTTDTWTPLGNATFTEDHVSTWFGMEPATVEVPIEQSVENPGWYRLQDPYYYVKQVYGGSITHNTNRYMYIDATNPESVYFEQFNTGYTPSTTYGTVTIWCYADYFFVDGQGTREEIADYGYGGTFSDGVIRFANRQLIGSMSKYNSGNLLGAGQGNFKIVLPGVTPPDYSIAIDVENCTDDNVFHLNIAVGEDVEVIKYQILAGNYNRTNGNYQIVAVDPNSATLTSGGSFTLDYSDVTADVTTYTILAATLDHNGNFAEGAGAYWFVVNDNDDQWETRGMTTFVDDIIAPLYNTPNYEFDCEIQENIYTPGYYRLVNPYEQFGYCDENHNHYIFINATDPNSVVLLNSPIGFEVNLGMASIVTKAAGTMTPDGTITFPINGIGYSEPLDNDGYAYTTNSNGRTEIHVPQTYIFGNLYLNGFDLDWDHYYAVVSDGNFEKVIEMTADEQPGLYEFNAVIHFMPTSIYFFNGTDGGANCTEVSDFGGNHTYTVTGQNEDDNWMLSHSRGTTGIDAIDANNAPATYYNLQGVRVAEPTNGLYIVVRGGKVAKETVR